MARAITPMTKLVFIANPNNPTATIVTASEVEDFMARVPDRVIVVFDEAYYEFAQGPDFPDALGYLRQGRKVVVLRTFSKAASLAGLRVGYAVGDPDCMSLLNRIRAPFNVNSLAQAAALAALEDDAHRRCRRMVGRAGPLVDGSPHRLRFPPRDRASSGRRRAQRPRRVSAPPRGRDRAALLSFGMERPPHQHWHAGEPPPHESRKVPRGQRA
jgi:hypothetical protein